MSFSASDYLARLSKASHSDYVSSYSALNEVLRTLTIEAQSFTLSKQEFFDQPRNTLTSGGTRYTRAPLGARGSATCCCVQTCQVNWTITIPANTIGIQLNRVNTTKGLLTNAEFAGFRTNFNGTMTATTALATNITQGTQHYNVDKVLKFLLGFSTACGPFQQIAICRDNTKLWETSIYAREQAIICSNSLSDLTVNNSVTVSLLESIVLGKRHCGVFIDIACAKITTNQDFYYRIPDPITFSGVIDLNQLNLIFNEFPVLTRNYASLYLQLWMTDFLQDLKVVWLNKSKSFDTCLAYAMIPAEKPDIITLLDDSDPPVNNFKVLDTDPATTENQNNFAGFIGTRSYPISTQIAQTPLVHLLRDSNVRIMFDDAPESQVLNLEVIGEISGSMIVADKESAQDKMSRVSYEKQRQGYEQIIDYPRYLINDQLTVWDTKLDREVNPQSKKSRSGGLISRQIRQMTDNNQQQFVRLVVELEFEITTTQPWRVRRIADGFMPNINLNVDGYMQLRLGRHVYVLHRLVALQFIPNDDPENKIQTDHVSQIRTDNSIDNLRWGGLYFVCAAVINGMRHKICYTKFQRFVGLI
ncbi:MAG: hypothetical protein EZS28_002411 [Streblomastix strix]|uniref:HNH nuclease domain-containing protein n=1 Tax=Streblomastix strix TaxID=222440 RepID=A0A5J4X511_9EUKA|nr:MAG: hypothetical protein EZS28_002411 [Streblomastix strix]